MIVNIKYSREDRNPFGRAYSYRTRLALGTGARVLCPTSSGMRTGVVVEINVPESAVDPDVLPRLREITQMAPAPRPEPKPVLVRADPDWDAGGTVTAEEAAPHPSADADTFPQGKAEGGRQIAAPTMDESDGGRQIAAPTGETEGEAAPEPEVPEIEGLVRVAQLPVIEERLRQIKDFAEGLAAEAASMAVTDETLTACRDRRAEINKLFKEMEEQRKAVKNAVMAPYNAFESVYKECVNAPFAAADNILRGKIEAVENELKGRCEDNLRKWFSELTLTHGVSWLSWEQVGVKVDLASARQKTPQKLMDQLNAFCSRVALDVEAISGMEDAVEIMAEYKKTLNMAVSVRVVKERHEAMERERIEAEERKRAQIARLEAEARVEAAAPEVLAPPVAASSEPRVQSSEETKVYKCSFKVRATKDQLRALKNFMKQEGISYE